MRLRPSSEPDERTIAAIVRRFLPRFGWATAYFAFTVLVGTVGYLAIEGWPPIDCFYMAVITVTSVGYEEVHPVSTLGRIFTSGLLGLGILGLGAYWALTTALIVEFDLNQPLRRRRSLRRMRSLERHFIACGLGPMGRMVLAELVATGTPVVAVDADPEKIAVVNETHPAVPTLEGDATKDHVLEALGVARARGLAACLPDDADNLFLCLTAKELAPSIDIAARAEQEESASKFRRAGADHIILPKYTGAVRMATMLARPSISSFLDAATAGSDISLRLEGVKIPESSPLVGMTLARAAVPQNTGLVVMALRHEHGTDRGDRYNPGPEAVIEAGDVMIVLGEEPQVEKLRRYVTGRLTA